MIERMCVSCKKRLPKEELIRISSDKQNAIIDQSKKQTSRAIYICKNEKCINILKKSNAIKRILDVQVNESFYDELLGHIEK